MPCLDLGRWATDTMTPAQVSECHGSRAATQTVLVSGRVEDSPMSFCFRAVLTLLICTSVATAADWPQWLGPSRDGASAEVVKAWTAPPTVVWRAAVGEGHSS